MLYLMKKDIFFILSYLITFFPNILLAADTTSNKIAEKPFYECLSGDISNPKKYCTKLPETKNKQPTKVQISLHLLDILDIDQMEGTWDVRTFMFSQWKDPRLKFNPNDFDGIRKLNYKGELADDQMLRMWHPNLTITNQISRREIENREISISKFGIVYYKEVFTAKIRTKLNFQKFPFDEHVLTIEVEPFSETQKLVRLVPAVRKNGNSSVSPDIWEVDKFKVEFSDRPGARNQLSEETGIWLAPDGSKNFSLMTFSLGIKRNYFNFLTTKLLVLYFFAFILWINAGFASKEGLHRWPWELFLGIIFFSLEAQSDLPALPYVTLYNVLVNFIYAYALIDFVLWIIGERLSEKHSSTIVLQRIKIWFVGPFFPLISLFTVYWYINHV